MRYLILSDIHANLTALDTVLSVAKGRWQKLSAWAISSATAPIRTK